MTTERMVQEALQAAGDPAGAFLWRRVCRDLNGELRIGVVAKDDTVAQRLVRQVGAAEHVQWVTLRVDETDADDGHPTLGTQDRMLGVHALVWATPAVAPLGGEERRGMAALVEAGAPNRRVVAIADLALLANMVPDEGDPEAHRARVAEEADEVQRRIESLAGESWAVVRGEDLPAWVARAKESHTELIRDRRQTVADLLLSDALTRATDAVAQAADEVARVEELLAAEDEQLEEARRIGRRVAAHLLGAIRRETESLLVDLGSFLVGLEGDIPSQVEAVDDLEKLRRTLPHWLHHVVEEWMEERLGLWRARVLEDLAEVNIDDADLDRAQLLVPGLHPAPVRAEGSWTQRVGLTAAVGGGAALILFQQWIPGVIVISGGIAFSALGRKAAEAQNRRSLVDTSIEAVRGMGIDADKLLRDQLASIEDELDRLGDERADAVARDRAVERADLQAQRTARLERQRALQAVLDELRRHIEGLREATA